MTFCRAFEDTDSEKMGNLMSIFFPKAAAPAPLEQVATQGGEPTVVSIISSWQSSWWWAWSQSSQLSPTVVSSFNMITLAMVSIFTINMFALSGAQIGWHLYIHQHLHHVHPEWRVQWWFGWKRQKEQIQKRSKWVGVFFSKGHASCWFSISVRPHLQLRTERAAPYIEEYSVAKPSWMCVTMCNRVLEHQTKALLWLVSLFHWDLLFLNSVGLRLMMKRNVFALILEIATH